MAELVGSVVKYLTVKETNIDNFVFKLFYKFTFILLFASSVLLHLTQFFGDPIDCNFANNNDFKEDYCWIHGSPVFSYEDVFERHIGCVIFTPETYKNETKEHLTNYLNDEDAPTTAYYQWVSLVLLFQAGSFVLPYKLWKMLEGGLMKSFGTEGKLKIMLGDDEEHIEGISKSKAIEKFVYYFLSTLHHNTSYLFKFVACEFLNFVILILNFSLSDTFLNGQFTSYGWDCWNFSMLSKEAQKFAPNPFCSTFPTEVNCNIKDVGAGGGIQNKNGMCILPQNIINQKIYLAFWFWFMFLFFTASVHLTFRVCTLFIPPLQSLLLRIRCYTAKTKETNMTINIIMRECYIGDWFLLHQLSKNVNGHFFRAFLEELRHRISTSKKKAAIV